MECLRILLTVGPPWLILGAEQHVTNTLSTILQSNADARKDAVSFIHELGTKGHTKFRSLVLKEAPEGAPAATQGQPFRRQKLSCKPRTVYTGVAGEPAQAARTPLVTPILRSTL